jgi:hypothetical protein
MKSSNAGPVENRAASATRAILGQGSRCARLGLNFRHLVAFLLAEVAIRGFRSSITDIDYAINLIQQALNRQVEEGYEEPNWPEAAVESLIERIGDLDTEQAVRGVVEAALRSGLYPRPWTRSLMFAPPSNRNRMLFTLTTHEDGRIDLLCEVEAFKTFFNLDPALVSQQIGP